MTRNKDMNNAMNTATDMTDAAEPAASPDFYSRLSPRAKETLDALASMVQAKRFAPGAHELGIPGFVLTVRTENNSEGCGFYEPSVGFILAGSKTSVIGEQVFEYDRGAMVITGMQVPSLFCAVSATAEHPFASISLILDAGILAELLAELAALEKSPAIPDKDPICFEVPPADEAVLEDFARLWNAVQDSVSAKLLAPLIVREIHLKLLLSSAGGMLMRTFTQGTQTNRIGRAVEWLRQNYEKPFSCEALADMVHMAPSTFHRHFKAVTKVSPLQYQKRLRLAAAQRLMMAEGLDAATAAYRVGYRSPAQFSRDYGKLYDESPKRHIKRLKSTRNTTYGI